ncbi:MAG: hypothetical protein OXC26_26335 [Albidovulum sp.]|nr:hypothetical protein [Albidovulum sp.]
MVDFLLRVAVPCASEIISSNSTAMRNIAAIDGWCPWSKTPVFRDNPSNPYAISRKEWRHLKNRDFGFHSLFMSETQKI